jgi:hypothetical protein
MDLAHARARAGELFCKLIKKQPADFYPGASDGAKFLLLQDYGWLNTL